jgi:TonB family protein
MRTGLTYADSQSRTRRLISMGITAGIYTVGLAAGILIGILNPGEQAFSNTTVVLNLSGPETPALGLGSINPSDKGEDSPIPQAPAPAKTVATAEKVDVPKAKSPDKPKDATSPASGSTAAGASKAVASEVPQSTAQTPGSASAQEAVAPAPEPYVAGPRGPGSRISSTNSAVNVPGQGEVPWTQGTSIPIVKSEKGNSMETKFGGAQGTVGQNIFSPVYYSFPLPKTISSEIFNAIPDLVQPPNTVIYTAQARKKAFLAFYEYDGANYRLKSDVPPANREPLWQMLEDAKYDSSIAEYKQGRVLMPVVLGFTITRDNQLKGVEILQSSGDPEIDRSVVYGFRRAAFWNKTGETVPGRFTYRF